MRGALRPVDIPPAPGQIIADTLPLGQIFAPTRRVGFPSAGQDDSTRLSNVHSSMINQRNDRTEEAAGVRPDLRAKIAVVIPSYRVKAHVAGVIAKIGAEVQFIYVVDDCCPEQSGRHVEATCRDPRVRVIYHEKNLGV